MLVELSKHGYYEWDLSVVDGAVFKFWDKFLDAMAENG